MLFKSLYLAHGRDDQVQVFCIAVDWHMEHEASSWGLRTKILGTIYFHRLWGEAVFLLCCGFSPFMLFMGIHCPIFSVIIKH